MKKRGRGQDHAPCIAIRKLVSLGPRELYPAARDRTQLSPIPDERRGGGCSQPKSPNAVLGTTHPVNAAFLK